MTMMTYTTSTTIEGIKITDSTRRSAAQHDEPTTTTNTKISSTCRPPRDARRTGSGCWATDAREHRPQPRQPTPAHNDNTRDDDDGGDEAGSTPTVGELPAVKRPEEQQRESDDDDD